MAVVRRCLGIFLFAVVFVPSGAAAHSNSVETNPADGARLEALPAEATLTFNEPPKTADVVLAGPGGEVRKLNSQIVGSAIKAQLPPTGPRGSYTLSWRVVSADGHPVSGSTTFTVTPRPAAAAPVPTPATSDTTGSNRSAGGPFVAVVIGVGVLGFVAMVLVARSVRR